MRGRLNLFQRTMLRWRDLYPYNAVHVVRVAHPFDADALVRAIARQLDAWGLRGLALDPRRRRFEFATAATPIVFEVVSDPEGADIAVEREIERQLNRAFPPGPSIDPFRFFAVVDGAEFHLGLAYDHFIASGDSAIRLLAAIVARYADPAAPDREAVPDRYPPTYRTLFALAPLLLPRMLARIPALIAMTRRAHRPHFRDPTDVYNGFARFALTRSQLDRMRARGRSWGVTFNDLLMAMLLHAMAPCAEGRSGERRRREICVASIVNIRAEFPSRAAGAFGQFLASFRIVHAVPPDATLERIARDMRSLTADIKRQRSYLRNIIVLAAVGMVWPFLSPRRRRRFFAKHHPSWGAVSSLNVDELWPKEGTAPRDYVRGVSTGPTVPLLLAVSTADGALWVGVSYHRGAFDRDVADRIEREFRACAGVDP